MHKALPGGSGSKIAGRKSGFMAKLGMIGAGSWGTALSVVLEKMDIR